MEQVRIYLESGSKKVIAAAVDWPGWCRVGKDEAAALNAFVQVAPRYAKIVKPTGLTFQAPEDTSKVAIVERVVGNAGTDFGVPSITLSGDAEPMDEAELARETKILHACWDAFDRSVEAARGKDLRKGPRGGGRELPAIVRHVAESESSYAGRIALKLNLEDQVQLEDLQRSIKDNREKVIAGLAEVAPVGLPPPGPRGGSRWPIRYFVRRAAYHVVDHIWEIEDRLHPGE